MSDKEKIPQFWDKGPMLVTGCTKVSPGCKNCWSERQHAMRAKRKNPGIFSPDLLTDGKFNGKVQFNLYRLEDTIKKAKPGEVIAIWNDLYHEGVSNIDIMMAHAMMQKATHHTFLIVTKRIERVAPMGPSNIHTHIWHIVTAENQARADERIPHLLRIPGKRGLIIEPMLGDIDLTNHRVCDQCGRAPYNPYMPEDWRWSDWKCPRHYDPDGRCDGTLHHGIHQVILGPENGPGKRPFNPAWAESVKAQCEAAGVPCYRKDTGEGVLAWRQ